MDPELLELANFLAEKYARQNIEDGAMFENIVTAVYVVMISDLQSFFVNQTPPFEYGYTLWDKYELKLFSSHPLIEKQEHSGRSFSFVCQTMKKIFNKWIEDMKAPYYTNEIFYNNIVLI
jgi:hypothetical protein